MFNRREKQEKYNFQINQSIEFLKAHQKKLNLHSETEFRNSQFINEIVDKLKRLNLILLNIIKLETIIIDYHAQIVESLFAKSDISFLENEVQELEIMLHVFLESMYYTSFRIYVIFRDFYVPRQNFNAKKISHVRNNLIEHPEISGIATGLTNEGGVKIKISKIPNFKAKPKATKTEEQVELDEGCFVNIEEFLDNLLKKLEIFN